MKVGLKPAPETVRTSDTESTTWQPKLLMKKACEWQGGKTLALNTYVNVLFGDPINRTTTWSGLCDAAANHYQVTTKQTELEWRKGNAETE